MNRTTSILLAVIITAQAFYNAGVVGYWLANRAYIASSLCENRDKPMKHCNGKCYLKKNLTTAASSQSDSNAALPVLKTETDSPFFLVDMPLLLFAATLTELSVLVSFAADPESRLPDDGIFHPPAFCA
jgi:hypothetical protein